MKTQHTPTPWRAQKFDDTKSTSIYGHNATSTLGSIRLQEDAAFIVRAVNSHEELLEAAKQLVAEARASDIITGYEGFIKLKKAVKQAEVK